MGLITFNEAAKIVGRSRQTISNWAAKGIFKVKNIAGTNYIDEMVVRLYLDDLNDIEETRIKIERLRDSLHKEYENISSEMLDKHIRRRYYYVCSSGVKSGYFSIVVKMLVEFGSISEKQGGMLLDFLRGMTLEEVACKYDTNREYVRQCLEKAVRRGSDITKFSDLCNELKTLKADNEVLKSKMVRLMTNTKADGEVKDNPNKALCQMLASRVI